MSASQLSRVLNGEKVFTIDQLDGVCTALGLNLVLVLDEADRASRPRRTDGASVHSLDQHRHRVGGSRQNDTSAEPAEEQQDAAASPRSVDRGEDGDYDG